MINFNCPHCGKGLKLSVESAGRKGKCKHCRRSITVPPSSERGNRSETGDCPSCGVELQIPPNADGTLVKCPDCNELMRITALGSEWQADVGSHLTMPEIIEVEDPIRRPTSLGRPRQRQRSNRSGRGSPVLPVVIGAISGAVGGCPF